MDELTNLQPADLPAATAALRLYCIAVMGGVCTASVLMGTRLDAGHPYWERVGVA